MTTYERLKMLEAFVYERLCKGRSMKTRLEPDNDADVAYAEPRVFLGLYPRRVKSEQDLCSVSPSILIAPLHGDARNMEEQRFDRYGGIHRPKDLGKKLPVQFIFSVYDPGIRGEEEILPDGEGDGLQTLLTWMDELERELLGTADIGDMFVWDDTIRSGLRTEQDAIVDSRPVLMGALNCTFGTMAYQKQNSEIRAMLDD